MSVVLKLVSGEEIFAQLVAVDTNMIKVANPMKIYKSLVETKAGFETKMKYEPWMDYAEMEEHILYRTHIMLCEPLSEFHTEFHLEMIENIAEMRRTTDANLRKANIKLH